VRRARGRLRRARGGCAAVGAKELGSLQESFQAALDHAGYGVCRPEAAIAALQLAHLPPLYSGIYHSAAQNHGGARHHPEVEGHLSLALINRSAEPARMRRQGAASDRSAPLWGYLPEDQDLILVLGVPAGAPEVLVPDPGAAPAQAFHSRARFSRVVCVLPLRPTASTAASRPMIPSSLRSRIASAAAAWLAV
jgi:hypothetical protein